MKPRVLIQVTVSVSDGKGGSSSIAVNITLTDVDENRARPYSQKAPARHALLQRILFLVLISVLRYQRRMRIVAIHSPIHSVAQMRPRSVL